MKFSDNLRNLRLQRGLTQMELAEGLKTSQSSITSWEQERREPDFRTIQRIADYFNVPLSSLLPSDDSNDNEYAQRVASSLNGNVKLRETFDVIKNFSDEQLSVILSVAKSMK